RQHLRLRRRQPRRPAAAAAVEQAAAGARAIRLSFPERLHGGTHLSVDAETAASEQLWGGETTKAVDNFPVSGERVPVPVVRWLGRIKSAAAEANAALGKLDGHLARPIPPARTPLAE